MMPLATWAAYKRRIPSALPIDSFSMPSAMQAMKLRMFSTPESGGMALR